MTEATPTLPRSPLAVATRALLAGLDALPLVVARDLGRALGTLADLAQLRMAQTSRRNLELCFPDLPAVERRRLARRSLAETGALAAELGTVWRAHPRRALARIGGSDGMDRFRARQAQGRGVLVLVPHLGNWEMLNLWLADQGPFTALYEPMRDPALDAWIRERRQRSGARLVPASAGGIRVLLRALRAGETVGILPDQVPPRGGGVHAPFFGAEALTMTLVSRLLRATGAAPLMATALRSPAGYGLHFLEPRAGLDAADPRAAASALNASVEDCVALSPAQYQWDYKRFKGPPEGVSNPYGRPGRRRGRRSALSSARRRETSAPAA
ncbi:MAG TPA: lysophospholipid acyltransferase family protein [Pseudomonadales bacterium]|nr:lysophospholipid acyltransferase family protein [Pseudomonadales bacterium]